MLRNRSPSVDSDLENHTKKETCCAPLQHVVLTFELLFISLMLQVCYSTATLGCFKPPEKYRIKLFFLFYIVIFKCMCGVMGNDWGADGRASSQRSRPELLSAHICSPATVAAKTPRHSDCLCPCASFKTDVAEQQHPLQHVLLLLLHFDPSQSMRLICCVCAR